MFDSFSNVIFILVALTIFIVRMFAETRKKKKKPPPAPRVSPLHFEVDDDDEIPVRSKTPAKKASKTKAVIKPSLTMTALAPEKDSGPPVATEKSAGVVAAAGGESQPYRVSAAPSGGEPRPYRVSAAPSAGKGGFVFNLNHLSPLKQAVVMAEILGPPKGMV